MPHPQLLIACATQTSASLFPRNTLLGRSLMSFPSSIKPRVLLLSDNKGEKVVGLPEFYNRVIESSIHGGDEAAIIVFVHDDVFIHDWNLAMHLDLALEHYDLVGVVGSAGVPNGQPGWWHGLGQDGRAIRNDAVERSGSINHFDPVVVRPDWYGQAPMACDLLDGVFLAARVSRLRATHLRFDTRFLFHCYDTDICCSARAKGLRVGTWPIPLTHGSCGAFDQEWIKAARAFQSKWLPVGL